MAEYTLDVTIGDDNIKEIKKAKDAAVAKVLEMIGQQAENYAKDNITAAIPRNADSWYVPTGRLRNSITHTANVERGEVYIGSNLEYAIYNEVGTGVYLDPDLGPGRQGGWWFTDENGEKHHTYGISAVHFLKRAIEEHQEEYAKMIHDVLGNAD